MIRRSGAGEPPAQATRFIGRKDEVRRVKRLLRVSRLVTVTGVAGIGKSRVAVRTASEVGRFFGDGVVFVELAGVSDPARLEQAVAHALDVTDLSAGPGDEVLAEHLRDRRVLLVLDTCEHLVDACAGLAQTLLQSSPRLRILATSRQPLGVPGEHIVDLPPMPLPGPRAGASATTLSRCDAVALFVDRARIVNPAYRLTDADAREVAEICARLEGIPLAIELVAVRTGELPLDRIRSLLDDRLWLLSGRTAGGRHPTVGATVDWSHELCTPDERLLWSRLPVFVSSFDAAAAEEVCADEALPAERVLPALLGLVDKSIVIPVKRGEGTVYRLLEIIREYGAAKLVEGGDTRDRERLRRRHLSHYRALALRGKESGRHGDQLETWRRVRWEWPNLRAALDLCAEDPALQETGLMTAAGLWYLWVACGMLREGRHQLERLLARPLPGRQAWAWGVLTLVYIANARGDLQEARRLLERCREHCPPGTPDGDLVQLVLLKMGGTLAFVEGDPLRAERMLGEVVERLRPARELPEVLLPAMVELGTSLVWGGEAAEAGKVFLECRHLCEELGETWASAYADYGLGLVAWAEGDAGRTAAHARDSLQVKRHFSDTMGIVFCLELLACAAAAAGDLVRAARLLAAAHAERCDKGLLEQGHPMVIQESARCARLLAREMPVRQLARATREGAALGLEGAIAYALDEEGAKGSAVRHGSRWAPLTDREGEVAELIAEGLTNRQIAHRLEIFPRTVDSHVEHILAKLDFTARAQIAAWVTRRRKRRG